MLFRSSNVAFTPEVFDHSQDIGETEAVLAQSVERKTLNLVVVGSSPTVGYLSFLTASLFSLGPAV